MRRARRLRQQQQQNLHFNSNSNSNNINNSLPSTSTGAGRLARLNIYETIGSASSAPHFSRSAGRLDGGFEESQRPLLAGGGDLSSDTHHLNRLSCSTQPIDAQRETPVDEETVEWRPPVDCDETLGRRHPNAHQTTPTTHPMDQSNQSNPYSEIFVPNEHQNQHHLAPGHYQVPLGPQAASLQDELDHLIESKRKRTLMLLRAREAPRASIELTSPIEETPQATTDHPTMLNSADSIERLEDEAQRCRSPALSDYENLHAANRCSTPTATATTNHSPPVDGDVCVQIMANNKGQSVISPSESQNFNTLSQASDILGDLSQEENSIVQQLGEN